MPRVYTLLFVLIFFNVYSQTDDFQLEIKESLDNIYGWNYKESSAHIEKVRTKWPQHPAGPLLKAVEMSWMNLGKLDNNAKLLTEYRKLLEASVDKAELMLKNPKTKVDAKYYLLMCQGFLALSYDFEKDYFNAVVHAKRAYDHMKDGLKLVDKNIEFATTSGLYKYYLVQYPITHPLAKPMMAFFAGGNKTEGLQLLERASKNALFSKAEATYYLMNVNLKYETNYPAALKYGQILNAWFPNNLMYKTRYIEGLLAMNKKTEVAAEADKLKASTNKVFAVAYQYFQGRLTEATDDKDAAVHYALAVKQDIESTYSRDFKAMAYLGLGRISLKQKNTSLAKEYYKRALNMTEYESVKAEAKAALAKI